MTSLLAVTTALGCISQPLLPEDLEVTELVVTPEVVVSQVGHLGKFTVESLDRLGNPVPGAGVEWESADPAVAVVDPDGTVWSFSAGDIGVEAKSKGRKGGKSNAPGQVKKGAGVKVEETQEVLPGTVTDLRVENVFEGTVQLAFTEVDDGAGQPADYLLRFQVEALSWSSAANVTFGSCGGQLSGASIGGELLCSVSELAPDVKYEFQVVALRGDLSSEPLYGDLSNTVSATTPPAPEEQTPATSPPPGGVITRHTFTEPLEDGWLAPRAGNYEHGFEGEDGYGQANFNTSLCVGCGPVLLLRGFNAVDEVTVRMRWQLSPNFDHNTGSNNKKILFLEASNTHPIILGTNQTSRMYFALQRTAEAPDGARHINGGSIEPGRIYDVEMYVKLNSVDANGNSRPDGIATVWVDGTRVIHATDVRYRGNDSYVAGETWEPSHGINGLRWNPTWPNAGAPPAEFMWERIYDLAAYNGSGG